MNWSIKFWSWGRNCKQAGRILVLLCNIWTEGKWGKINLLNWKTAKWKQLDILTQLKIAADCRNKYQDLRWLKRSGLAVILQIIRLDLPEMPKAPSTFERTNLISLIFDIIFILFLLPTRLHYHQDIFSQLLSRKTGIAFGRIIYWCFGSLLYLNREDMKKDE